MMKCCKGAIPVLVPANSCMIFDRRLWHAATPNWAQRERMVVFMVPVTKINIFQGRIFILC